MRLLGYVRFRRLCPALLHYLYTNGNPLASSYRPDSLACLGLRRFCGTTGEDSCFIVIFRINGSEFPTLIGLRLSKCFSTKFRTLLGNRMLHSNICFGLQATYNLHTAPNPPVRPWYVMGNALGCSLGLNPFLSETHRSLHTFYPSVSDSCLQVYEQVISHDAATLVGLLNRTVLYGMCHYWWRLSRAFRRVTPVYRSIHRFSIIKVSRHIHGRLVERVLPHSLVQL